VRTFRLIRCLPAPAAGNMALDEALLESVGLGGPPTLRLYGWSSPSFSIGRFQAAADGLDQAACGTAGVEVVRRPTGGGILFHHDEVTYSVACRKDDLAAGGVPLSYRDICSFLVRFYRSLGLAPAFALDVPAGRPCGPSVICCAGREKHDIVVGGRKLGGNAQRRTRTALLQHGAVPRAIDWSWSRKCLRGFAPAMEEGATSLAAELGSPPSIGEMAAGLAAAFEESFGVTLHEEQPSAVELELMRRLVTEKYGGRQWNELRAPDAAGLAPQAG
jgi:lipoate-protein ligase A